MLSRSLRWIIPLAIVAVIALLFVFAPAVLTHAAGANPH